MTVLLFILACVPSPRGRTMATPCGPSARSAVDVRMAYTAGPTPAPHIGAGLSAGRVNLVLQNSSDLPRWVLFARRLGEIAATGGIFRSISSTAPTGLVFQRYRDPSEREISVISFVGEVLFFATRVPAGGELTLSNVQYLGAADVAEVCSADALYRLEGAAYRAIESPLEVTPPREFSGPLGPPHAWVDGPAAVSLCAAGWACERTEILH